MQSKNMILLKIRLVRVLNIMFPAIFYYWVLIDYNLVPFKFHFIAN